VIEFICRKKMPKITQNCASCSLRTQIFQTRNLSFLWTKWLRENLLEYGIDFHFVQIDISPNTCAITASVATGHLTEQKVTRFHGAASLGSSCSKVRDPP